MLDRDEAEFERVVIRLELWCDMPDLNSLFVVARLAFSPVVSASSSSSVSSMSRFRGENVSYLLLFVLLLLIVGVDLLLLSPDLAVDTMSLSRVFVVANC